MPEDVGGGGLDTLTWMLVERELGHTGYALQMLAVARPSRILLACEGDQRASYLLPVVAGERTECLAMTEPEAGSDLRGMRTRAVRDGDDWLITGTKHFISHADAADFVILFAATGEQELTAFLVDVDAPGLAVLPGYRSVSHRGYGNAVLVFDGCRVPGSAVLGEVGRGFDVANTWLGTTRLQVAASCLGRARRALDLAVRPARSAAAHRPPRRTARRPRPRRRGDRTGRGAGAGPLGGGLDRGEPADRHGRRRLGLRRAGGDMTGVRTRELGAVLEVTLDRPPANAIDLATSRAMGEVFAAFRDDRALRVAVLRTAGERFFSAGWDLKAAAAG